MHLKQTSNWLVMIGMRWLIFKYLHRDIEKLLKDYKQVILQDLVGMKNISSELEGKSITTDEQVSEIKSEVANFQMNLSLGKSKLQIKIY